MAQPPHNPLLHPPFFSIPGINPASPVSTQTEQIDQLNTLLLQEIDANFAKFHQVVTSRILPEIKRFAIAGEPTRETAHFWKKFYEAAAGVRSTVEGESTVHDQSHSQETYEDHTLTMPRDDDQSFSSAHEEGSFMFGKGATASTPLGKHQQYTGNESWESSMESPFDRTDRKLREMEIGGGQRDEYEDSNDLPTPSLPTGYGAPGPDDYSSSLSPSIRPAGDKSSSSRPMSSTPKAARATSSYITDLRTTPLNAKFPKSKLNIAGQSGLRSTTAAANLDDSDNEMSPLTMNYNQLPPRAQAFNAAVRDKTPKKGLEANAILSDLMSEMSPMSPRADTPDFARKYNTGRNESVNSSNVSVGPEREEPVIRETRKSMANTSFGSDIVSGPGPLGLAQADDSYDQDDSFSSDGSGTVPPPGEYRSDISYTTNTPGATARYGNAGDFSTTIHRGAGDDNEVFGAPNPNPGAASGERPAFDLMKQDEMYTYMGGRLEDAAGTDETPLKKHSKKQF